MSLVLARGAWAVTREMAALVAIQLGHRGDVEGRVALGSLLPLHSVSAEAVHLSPRRVAVSGWQAIIHVGGDPWGFAFMGADKRRVTVVHGAEVADALHAALVWVETRTTIRRGRYSVRILSIPGRGTQLLWLRSTRDRADRFVVLQGAAPGAGRKVLDRAGVGRFLTVAPERTPA